MKPEALLSKIDQLPKHIAIIMDGNGRWAKKKGLGRIDGHKAGVKTALDIVQYCGKLGIRYLTLYAFSSENWRRPENEVIGLMQLLHYYLKQETRMLVENGVALSTIGIVERLPHEVRVALLDVCKKTAGGSRMQVILALSYGSRDEIVRAARKIVQEALAGRIDAEKIDEELFATHLDTHGIPDPDLFIRTSGEMRLSNFLLWQMSYTELYVANAAWPDFSCQDLDQAILEYGKRQRRFGMISEQLE